MSVRERQRGYKVCSTLDIRRREEKKEENYNNNIQTTESNICTPLVALLNRENITKSITEVIKYDK